MRKHFPMSAIVGQQELKIALMLVAIDPTIGGVLISGERGTAKSTAARALAALLPEGADGGAAPFVELPLGVTEDRVVGSLDVSQALQHGRSALRSGLLARADGGVLYVDEVNLLPDHIVDLLLDAAAGGWVTIERDGLSAVESARFILVGTMNPEEGQLRPQFLDRFGLCVQVAGLKETQERIQAVRQRIAFDDSPGAYLAGSSAAESGTRELILRARASLRNVVVTDANLLQMAELARQYEAVGIRGDIVGIKAARALAAWEGVEVITPQHLERVAKLALSHRIPRRSHSQRRPSPSPRPPPASDLAAGQSGSSSNSSSGESPMGERERPERKLRPADAAMEHQGPIELLTERAAMREPGRREGRIAGNQRIIGAREFDGTGSLAVRESLTRAALRGSADGRVAFQASDLRQLEREGLGRFHVLFVVDASGSMGAGQRLAYATEVAVGLLTSNYERRDEVALMVFRGTGVELVLPFTRDVAQLEEALRDVPTGGRTPLADALHEAAQLLRRHQPGLVVLFTDGRANVSLGGGDPWQDAQAACAVLAESCAGALVVNCESGPISLGRAEHLAQALQAECIAPGSGAGEVIVRLRDRIALR